MLSRDLCPSILVSITALKFYIKGFLPRLQGYRIRNDAFVTPAKVVDAPWRAGVHAPSPSTGEGWGEGDVGQWPLPTPSATADGLSRCSLERRK